MKRCVWKVLVVCLCCIAQYSEAQTGKVYTTDMGLSSSLINQIFQDKQGFIWVTTEYGLNKFDGIRFVPYYKGAPGKLSASPITGIFQLIHLLSRIIMYVLCLRIVDVICWWGVLMG